jgi:hypothetical protein
VTTHHLSSQRLNPKNPARHRPESNATLLSKDSDQRVIINIACAKIVSCITHETIKGLSTEYKLDKQEMKTVDRRVSNEFRNTSVADSQG